MGHLRLTAAQLHAGYGDRAVLAGADIDVMPAGRLAVLGANGSGKTTLLRCLAGSLQPSAGQIRLGSDNLAFTRRGLLAHRRQVQFVAQDPDDQLFSADVRRDVSFGPLNLGLPADEVRGRVEHALGVLGIDDLAERPIHELSWGQRKRVAIAGALAMQPCVLLLDEPTAGLDPAGVEEMLTALADLERDHTTVAIATHDVDLALRWATQVAVVVNRVVRQGDPAEILSDRELLAQARLQMPWPLQLAERLGLPRTVACLDDVVAALTDRLPST